MFVINELSFLSIVTYRSFYFNKIRTVSNEQFKDIAPSIRFL